MQSSLVQLTYLSKSTSSRDEISNDINDILQSAHQYNEIHQLYGVLYFGAGYYFQCLEGNKEQVELLMNKIQHDPRHTQIQQISCQAITDYSFKRWSMKYVVQHDVIEKLLSDMGFKDDENTLLDGREEILPLLIETLYQQ